jgi:hypothetical protein
MSRDEFFSVDRFPAVDPFKIFAERGVDPRVC